MSAVICKGQFPPPTRHQPQVPEASLSQMLLRSLPKQCCLHSRFTNFFLEELLQFLLKLPACPKTQSYAHGARPGWISEATSLQSLCDQSGLLWLSILLENVVSWESWRPRGSVPCWSIPLLSGQAQASLNPRDLRGSLRSLLYIGHLIWAYSSVTLLKFSRENLNPYPASCMREGFLSHTSPNFYVLLN